MAKPEVIATQLVPPEAAASPPCANAGMEKSDNTTKVKIKKTTLRILHLLKKYRQEVVDVILEQTPSR
jgi:hypothetical protein